MENTFFSVLQTAEEGNSTTAEPFIALMAFIMNFYASNFVSITLIASTFPNITNGTQRDAACLGEMQYDTELPPV